MRADKKSPLKSEKKTTARGHKRGVAGYSKKTALLEEAITQMNAGKYGRSSAALKELLALDPLNMEARRLFATLHLRLGSLIPARQAFESLINEAFERQDYWLAESLLREYLAAGPRCVPFLEKLGAVFQEKGNTLEAVAEYGKAIDILIEDPDPDNPQHAAQLYAKIRDLAPASPVAFRLASFFDAQTGELISPPAVVQTEPEVPHSLDPPTEVVNNTAGMAMPEPMVGVMPWEQVEDHTTSSLCSTPIEPITQPAASTNDPIEIDRQTDLAPSPHSLNQTDELHLSEPILVPGPEINTNLIPQDFHNDTAADTQPSRASIAAEDTPVALSKLETPPTIVTDLAPPVSSQESESLSPQDQGAAVPESISSPMPWEHVQESTIRIPDHVSDDLPAPLVQTEEPSRLTPHEHAPLTESRDDSPNVAPLISAGTGHSQVAAVTDEPPMSAHESVPDIPPAPTLQERSKGPGFSWESVFDSAWKFGDKFSSSTPPIEAKEAKQTEAKQQEEKIIDPGTASQQASVAAPMPWDQVQDTIVTIPPPEVEVAAEVPEAEAVQPDAAITMPQGLVANQTPTEPVPAQTAMEEDSFSIAQSLPAPLSAEPEFRLLGMAAEPVVEALQRSREEAGPQFSPTTEVSAPADPIETEPLAAYDEVNSTLPAGAQPSQLPAELKKDEVESPAIIADQDHNRLLKQQPVDPSSFIAIESAPKVEIVPAVPNQVEPAILSREETTPLAPIGSALSIAEPASLVEVAPPLPADEQPLALAREEISPAAPAEHSIEYAQLSSVVETSAPTEVTRTASVEMPVAQPATESAQTPPEFRGDPSHWSTGEVAVQSHRPTPKKRKRAAVPSSESTSDTSQVEDRSALDQAALRPVEPPVCSVEVRGGESALRTGQEKDEWIRTGESIRFIEPELPPRVEPVTRTLEREEPRPALSTAASAVDVLFESSGRLNRSGPRERVPEPKPRPRLRAKLARARIGVVVFISSCFSTTRAVLTSLVALLLLSGALMALAIGAVGLTWTIMEERPSPAFQSLTTSPQHTLSDQKKNGYLLLLGFDAPVGQDPFQAGYERKPDAKDAGFAAACLGGPNGGSPAGQTTASASVASGWFQGSDPVAQFKTHQDTIKGWMSQAEPALGRYKQWLKLPFEDWGYGQAVSPPCSSILFAHQLYLADGFVLSVDAGVDRLETDMEAWRIALGQAKTLPVKTMALEAINNDVAVASGLLVKPDFDGRLLGRLTKMLRPLDQVELSIRWPMQSELVTASKTFDAQMKAVRGDELPWHAMVASALPLPRHRRFNDYASYYEASYKAAGEGRYGSLPKWGHYIHFPAHTLADYLTNPIENIVGLEPLPAWDRYNGIVVDTDAHLRLASLQAWLRRGTQDADLLARIAKAGQSVYDPYTGLPMLVNLKRGVMYSVGHDGKDQDADPQTDVVVAIPLSPSFAISPRSTSSKVK